MCVLAYRVCVRSYDRVRDCARACVTDVTSRARLCENNTREDCDVIKI